MEKRVAVLCLERLLPGGAESSESVGPSGAVDSYESVVQSGAAPA